MFQFITHSCMQTDIVEQGASLLCESDAHFQDSESGCGPFVHRKSFQCEADSASGCSGSDMVTFLPLSSRVAKYNFIVIVIITYAIDLSQETA